MINRSVIGCQVEQKLTVYHFRGHDSLSLAVFNGIVLWGATDQTGTGYRVPPAFESDVRSGAKNIDKRAKKDGSLSLY